MKTIHHLVDIDADVPTVWSALTVQADMARWWTTKVEAPDAGVGTVVRWTFVGDFNPDMEIIAVDQPRELVWRCVGGHAPWDDGTFRFTLEDLGGRCRLRFWQDYAVELDDDAYGTYNFNWGYYLESIRLACVTGEGKPFSASA